MDWSGISDLVGKAAPLVGTLLCGPAGTAVGGMIASALGTEADPQAVSAMLQQDPEAAAKIRALELDNKAELTRMHLEAETARLAEVNQTMRAEAASADPYVRRWRPTFGYLTAAAWIIQCSAVAWSIVAEPAQAGSVAQAVTALTPMWGVALAVLGVNVAKRSQDKQVQAGQTPAAGLLGAIAKRVAG